MMELSVPYVTLWLTPRLRVLNALPADMGSQLMLTST